MGFDLERQWRIGRLCDVEARRPRPDDDRAGLQVYRGMIIGEHTRENDLEINVLKGKQLTNIRAAGKDEAVRLTRRSR